MVVGNEDGGELLGIDRQLLEALLERADPQPRIDHNHCVAAGEEGGIATATAAEAPEVKSLGISSQIGKEGGCKHVLSDSHLPPEIDPHQPLHLI